MNSATRKYWVDVLWKIAFPVFSAMAEGKLREWMPVDMGGEGNKQYRKDGAKEAFCRSLAGISSWLEVKKISPSEEKRRSKMEELVLRSFQQATDPSSGDFMNFETSNQSLVEAAFLAQGLLRAPKNIWNKLEAKTKLQIITQLKSTRSRTPALCNWLLFPAIIEAFLCKIGEDWDRTRIDHAIRHHEQWYKGDGMYGDGPFFRWDYYNSFVIHPMILDIMAALVGRTDEWEKFHKTFADRSRRFAAIQERLIAPDGTFPPIGRSLTYRFGAFQLLSQMALREELPAEISPAQVRCGLTAVIRRTMKGGGVFDKKGWLKIGFVGHQPSLGEYYISTGSLYICLSLFLPLGLSEKESFWNDPPRDWTAKKIWAGKDFACDRALDDEKQPVK